MSANYYELLKYAATGIASSGMTYYDRMRVSTLMGGAVQTLTGIPPLSFKADGSPLISWSMKGNGSQQTGTPTSDAPIMPTFCGVRTGNLAPPLTEWVDGYVGSNGKIATSSALYKEKSSDFLEIPTNAANVSFSGEDGVFEVGSSGAWRAIGFYDSNMRFISRAGGAGANYISASVPENAKFMRISCRTYESDKEYMLNTGSTALPYEPYGWAEKITCAGQTVPLYLGEVPTVRRIKKLVLTGKENWSKSSAQAGRYNLFVSDYLKEGGEITSICTHFTAAAQQSGGQYPDGSQSFYSGSDTARFMFLHYAAMETLDDFKAYLAQQYAAGTPVTVWYVLAEPETAIVNEPLCKIGDYADELNSADAGVSIPTVKGANTLTVETDLQPSEMTIMYRK